MLLLYRITETCVPRLLPVWRNSILICVHRKSYSRLSILPYFSNSYAQCQFSTSEKQRGSSSVKKSVKLTSEQKNESNIETINELVAYIVSRASETDKMIGSIQHSKIKTLIERLFSLGFSEEQISKSLIENPSLLKQHKLIPTTEFLMSCGFNVDQILNIFTSMGKVTALSPNKIQLFLESLRNTGFEDKTILTVAAAHPRLLVLNPNEVAARVAHLKELFKSRDVVDLIEKTPDIMFQDWDTIQEKFDYVHHVMGVSQRQMMYTNMFSYSLEHIQCRHIFLVRAGFYLKPRRREGEINTNPRLQEIIDVPDDKFAKRFGGMTPLDYEVFCKLFGKEAKQTVEEMMDES